VSNSDDLQRLNKKSLDRFRQLFRGRTDWYGHRDFRTNKCWTEGARGTDGKLLKDDSGNNLPPIPLEDEHFHRHFNTVMGLGIIPIQKNGNVNFGVLDIDKDDIDHIDLVKRIQNLGLPLYVFVSRSLAAHAFYFVGGEGKPAHLVQKRLEQWALAIGCGSNGLIAAEIFPKQKDVDKPESVGNYINLPFFHEFNNEADPDDKRGKFVTKDGQYVGIEDFLSQVEVADPKLGMPLPIRTVAFEQGPPCLETLQQKGIPEGMRNNGLYNVGVYFKKSDPENWEDLLQAYNNKFMVPPFHDNKMPKKEMMDLIKSIRKKEYQYKCHEDPIASHCEKSLCRTRLYGIKTKEELLREKVNRMECPVEGVTMYMSDPVTWRVHLRDGINVNVSGAELMSFPTLRRYLLDALGEVPPIMKEDEWKLKLDDLLKEKTVEEVSEDSGEMPMLLKLLNEFVYSGSGNPRMVDSMSCYLQWDEAKQGSMAHFTGPSIREYMLAMKISVPPNRLAVVVKQDGWQSSPKRIIPGESPKRVWWKFIPGLKPRYNDDLNVGDTVDEALSRTDATTVHESEGSDAK
jgi:hypothetical protein